MEKKELKKIVEALLRQIRAERMLFEKRLVTERTMFEQKLVTERDKTLETIKQNKRDMQLESREIFVLYSKQMSESFDRFVEGAYKKFQGINIADSPDGPLAVINNLAVESLFVLGERVRNKNKKEFVSLRLLLNAVENWSRAKMTEEAKGEVYCGLDPPLQPKTIKIIERLKESDEGE